MLISCDAFLLLSDSQSGAATREDPPRDDANKDDALSGFDEELLQRVQAQLERIDFALDGKEPHQAESLQPPAGADAQVVSQAPQIPEGVTFDGTRTIPQHISC